MLCYVVPCHVVLMLFLNMFCSIMSRCAVVCYVMLDCVVLCCVVLCYDLKNSIVSCCF